MFLTHRRTTVWGTVRHHPKGGSLLRSRPLRPPPKGHNTIPAVAGDLLNSGSSGDEPEVRRQLEQLLTGAHSLNSYPIVKRRIAWLLGKLISDECLKANNQSLWQVLVHLLQDQGEGSDAVVRLTAAIAIRECVDVRAHGLS